MEWTRGYTSEPRNDQHQHCKRDKASTQNITIKMETALGERAPQEEEKDENGKQKKLDEWGGANVL